MANTFLTANQISSAAIGLLARDIVLPMTVVRVPNSDFGGQAGDTVTIRVRAKVAAREQATPGAAITYDDVTETSVSVALSHLYNGVKVTDEDLNLGIDDFGAQVLEPQAAGIAEGAEQELADVMNALAADASFDLTASDADTESKILGAREALSSANVPAGDRYLAVSPEIATRILSLDKFVKVNESGSDSAFRDATFGRLYGFTIVESNALTSGTAVAYHRTSFAMGLFSPEVPSGAADGAQTTYGGIALRWIRHYDPDILSDRSVLSTFAGAAGVDAANRAYKLDTATA